MKRRYKVLLSVLIILVLSFGVVSVSFANTTALEGYQVSSRGRLDYDANKDGDYEDNEDVVVDSRDFTMISNRLSNGKAVLSYALNAYPNVNLNQNDTFVNYAVAIANLTNLPSEKYYYDITTGVDDSSTIVRYVKEDTNYYPCDEHGNKLSNTPASVDASNLMAYTSAASNNASLGKACVVNGKPVLGNGADVLDIKNQIKNGKTKIAGAITEAGVETSSDDSFEQMATNILLLKGEPPNPDDFEVVITYHTHTGNATSGGGCYSKKNCTGTIAVKMENDDCVSYSGHSSPWVVNCIETNYPNYTKCPFHDCYYTWDDGCAHCSCPRHYECPECGKIYSTATPYVTKCSNTVYSLNCGKTTKTIESYKVYYKGKDVTN